MLALIALAACGEVEIGAPVDRCADRACTELHVVAHQDDDLLFVPDLAPGVADGRRVVTVYTTAGRPPTPRAWPSASAARSTPTHT